MLSKARTATILAGTAAALTVVLAPTAAASTSCVLPPDAGNMPGTPCIPTITNDGSDKGPAQAPEQFALGGLHHEQ